MNLRTKTNLQRDSATTLLIHLLDETLVEPETASVPFLWRFSNVEELATELGPKTML